MNQRAIAAIAALSLTTIGIGLLKTAASADLGSAAQTAQSDQHLREPMFGFTLDGEIINPRCLDLLQTSLAETTPIILRSLVLETCQTSELAHAGQDYAIDSNGSVFYVADPENPRSFFGYRVLGRTEDDRFAVYHNGTIGLYQLETASITFDFLDGEAETVQVLTKLSESFTPCFQSGRVDERDRLIAQLERYEPNAPRSEQCTGEIEVIQHQL
ncbi:MAG: hypothetical protein AAGF66_10200 [Cyanobacteria bacterium P01_H01_bin.119]